MIGKKGASNVVSFIMKTLRELNLLHTDEQGGKLNNIFDNCTGQNKNNMVLRLPAWLSFRPNVCGAKSRGVDKSDGQKVDSRVCRAALKKKKYQWTKEWHLVMTTRLTGLMWLLGL